MAFRPNLADRAPAPIATEADWLSRSGRFFLRHAARLINPDEPLVRSQ
jgi:hypothetical protein